MSLIRNGSFKQFSLKTTELLEGVPENCCRYKVSFGFLKSLFLFFFCPHLCVFDCKFTKRGSHIEFPHNSNVWFSNCLKKIIFNSFAKITSEHDTDWFTDMSFYFVV